MIRSFALVLVLLDLSLSVQAQPAAPTPATRQAPVGKMLTAITEVRAVHLEKAVTFWRHGEAAAVHDAVLLRVRIGAPYLFLFFPMDRGPPVFLYGNWVCEMLQSPLVTGEAVLLAPRPAAGKSRVLWLIPSGLAPQELNRQTTETHRKSATLGASTSSLSVTLPAAKARPKVYRDLNGLIAEVYSRLR